MSLTKKRAERFAKKVTGRHVSVSLLWESRFREALDLREGELEFVGWASKDGDILFCRNAWSGYSEIVQKVMLLHEVGHVLDESDYSKAIQREFNAHVWAVQTAEGMGMTAVAREARSWFRRWQLWDWNSRSRRYMIAGRMAIERGLA